MGRPSWKDAETKSRAWEKNWVNASLVIHLTTKRDNARVIFDLKTRPSATSRCSSSWRLSSASREVIELFKDVPLLREIFILWNLYPVERETIPPGWKLFHWDMSMTAKRISLGPKSLNLYPVKWHTLFNWGLNPAYDLWAIHRHTFRLELALLNNELRDSRCVIETVEDSGRVGGYETHIPQGERSLSP